MSTQNPEHGVVVPIVFAVVWFAAVGLAASGQTGQVGTTGTAMAGEPAMATCSYEVDGVRVALLSVQRVADGTVTVKWQYRNDTDEPKHLGESFTGMGSSEAYSLAYYAYLTDARDMMKYPVLKDTRGVPVAAKHAGRKVVVLAPHKTLDTWAKFMAPPAGTTKVSVYIPGAQPFEEVTIREAR